MPLPIDTKPVPTPTEQSRADTGQMFHRLTKVEYEKLASGLNAEQGLPKGVGTKAVTLRAIPEFKDVPKDDKGDAVLSMPVRFDGVAVKVVLAKEVTKLSLNAEEI